MSENLLDTRTIVSDFDDTIVFQTPHWVRKAVNHFNLDFPNLSIKRVFDREKYYLTDNFLPIEKEEMEDFMNLYKDDPNFYSLQNTPLTAFGIALQKMVKLHGMNVIILTTTLSCDKHQESKNNFIKSLGFNNIINIPLGESKAKTLATLEFETFADDHLDHHKDLVSDKSGKFFGKELLIPRYNFNKVNDEFIKIAKGKLISIKYFDPFELK